MHSTHDSEKGQLHGPPSFTSGSFRARLPVCAQSTIWRNGSKRTGLDMLGREKRKRSRAGRRGAPPITTRGAVKNNPATDKCESCQFLATDEGTLLHPRRPRGSNFCRETGRECRIFNHSIFFRKEHHQLHVNVFLLLALRYTYLPLNETISLF